MQITQRKINVTPVLLIKVALIGLLLLQVYSYMQADWVASSSVWSDVITLSKHATSNKFVELVRLALFFAIILASLVMHKHNAHSWIYIFVLTSFVIVYSAEAVMNIGISDAIYSGNLPIIYLLIAGFFLGEKTCAWDGIKGVFLYLMLAYAVLFAVEFIDSYMQFGWVIYSNSSMMTYYSQLFWLSVAYIYVCITDEKRKVLIYPILIVLFVGAVLLRSRSWLIQAVLLIIIASFTMYRKKKKSMRVLIKGLIVVGAILIIATVLLNTYFKPFLDSLLEKGDVDSRGFQYIEMLEQVEPYKWLFGQGMTATYTSKLYGEYAFIDNEFFYMSFHYGIFFALIYFAPYVMTVLNCLRAGKNMSFGLFSALVIILWIASVNGLSVFNRIHLDIKSFIMPFLAGHIYQTAKDYLEKENEL